MSAVRVVWQLATGREAADRLLAEEVADVLGVAPEEVHVARSCPRCGGSDHGRPVVVADTVGHPPHVSLARAEGIVVVAVSTDRPVGVDVERIDQTWPSGSADVLLHPDELADDVEDLTRLWVRKESLLKASGDGLAVEPSALRMTAPWEEPRLLEWSGGSAGATTLQDLEIDGYAACVAVLGQEALSVKLRRAGAGEPSRAATPRTGHAGRGRSGSPRAR